MTFLQPALLIALPLARSARQWLYLLSALMFVGCNSTNVSAERFTGYATSPAKNTRPLRWNGKTFDQIRGFRFVDCREVNSILHGDLHFLDLKLLERLKRKEVVLTKPQEGKLLEAIYSSDPSEGSANCYSPHHIFIFYSDGKPTGAFEVCFECNGCALWPSSAWSPLLDKYNVSYHTLAELCKELGLKTSAPFTLRRFFRNL